MPKYECIYDEQEILAPPVTFLKGQAVKTWDRAMGLADAPEQNPADFNLSCSKGPYVFLTVASFDIK